MKNKTIFYLFICTITLLSFSFTEFNGQLSSWAIIPKQEVSPNIIGLRYIPEMKINKGELFDMPIDGYFALNINASGEINKSNFSSNLSLYRGWLRYTSAQSETRLGLQKINFGPAKILRSLQWFDQMSPTDPLGLTNGVSGLLTRYYSLDNSNVWLWALVGNEDLKGFETTETLKNSIEIGGRYQFPFYLGELGLSSHTRQIQNGGQSGNEYRLGFDGEWDVGFGLWLETTIQKTNAPWLTEWKHVRTLGVDTTIEVGSGLHILLEHQNTSAGSELFKTNKLSDISALSADYPLNMLDSVSAIITRVWTLDKNSFFISWQRTLDEWSVNVSAFNDEVLANSGVQVMIAINH
ncbi:MAG: hypothetical protein PHF25_00220 [Candidatus Margulisbacteria bacterium]|nr:hypothetical protein [Candidatus Margulisiibacteriota bacterium]